MRTPACGTPAAAQQTLLETTFRHAPAVHPAESSAAIAAMSRCGWQWTHNMDVKAGSSPVHAHARRSPRRPQPVLRGRCRPPGPVVPAQPPQGLHATCVSSLWSYILIMGRASSTLSDSVRMRWYGSMSMIKLHTDATKPRKPVLRLWRRDHAHQSRLSARHAAATPGRPPRAPPAAAPQSTWRCAARPPAPAQYIFNISGVNAAAVSLATPSGRAQQEVCCKVVADMRPASQ
jgi:hypothetical protein